MATAKQRAWRAKFARLYGGKSRRSKRKTQRVVNVARRSYRSRARSYYRRARGSRAGGLLMNGLFGSKIPMGMVGKVAAGALISYGMSKYNVPVLSSLPMADKLTAAAVGGLPAVAGAFLVGMIPGTQRVGAQGFGSGTRVYG